MAAKADFVEAYFARWDKDLGRAKTLLAGQDYYLEAMLVLSCHIGALASLRFPGLADNVAYKRVVLDYSGMRDFYEQIDLLFFLQWPRSDFASHGDFLKLKSHSEVARVIEAVFGREDEIREAPKRYVSPQSFLTTVSASPFPGFDKTNLQQYLPLFSNVELLYRYVRCRAVHSLHFPFVTQVHFVGGDVCYRPNHPITGEVLYQTAFGILDNLRTECLRDGRWPWEL